MLSENRFGRGEPDAREGTWMAQGWRAVADTAVRCPRRGSSFGRRQSAAVHEPRGYDMWLDAGLENATNRNPKPIKWSYSDPSHRIRANHSAVTVH